MKNCLFKLTLVAAGTMLASHVYAQSVVQLATPTSAPAPAPAPTISQSPTGGKITVAANAKAPMPTSGARSSSAAGSVVVLADGIVFSPAVLQIQPPAPGFAYER